MSDYTRRFLRSLILAGLPFGSFFAMYYAIDRGWQTGILTGAIAGLLLGLLAAYVNARASSKPTYQLTIPASYVSNSYIKSEFTLQSFFTLKHLASVVLPLLIIVASIAISTDANRFLQLLFTLVVLVLITVWDASRHARIRLTINSHGIKFVSVFHTLEAAWEDIAQIERRGQHWFIVCRSTTLTASPLFRRWLHFVEADKIIALSEFSSDFLKSELASSIFHYGNQVKITASEA